MAWGPFALWALLVLALIWWVRDGHDDWRLLPAHLPHGRVPDRRRSLLLLQPRHARELAVSPEKEAQWLGYLSRPGWSR